MKSKCSWNIKQIKKCSWPKSVRVSTEALKIPSFYNFAYEVSKQIKKLREDHAKSSRNQIVPSAGGRGIRAIQATLLLVATKNLPQTTHAQFGVERTSTAAVARFCECFEAGALFQSTWRKQEENVVWNKNFLQFRYSAVIIIIDAACYTPLPCFILTPHCS